MLSSVQPAYSLFAAQFENKPAMTTDEDGALEAARADTYYTTRLKNIHDDGYDRREIHEIGLKSSPAFRPECRNPMTGWN